MAKIELLSLPQMTANVAKRLLFKQIDKNS